MSPSKYLWIMGIALLMPLAALATVEVGPGSGGGGSGTVTSVTASSPISVANPTTTPALTLGVVPVAKGGTNSSAALSSNRFMVSSGAAVVEAAAVATGAAVVTDGNGLPSASSTTATELGFVHGLTSALQTQLNGKQASGSYLTGLTGDVTATGAGVTVVALVGSSSAANVHAAELATNAATSAAVNATLVKRDGSAGFAGNLVQANVLQLNANGHTLQIVADAALAANGTFYPPSTQGTVGQVLTSGGAAPATWAPAGISQTTLNNTLHPLIGKHFVDLVCTTQTTLSGTQTCDGVSSQSGDFMLAIGQTTVSEDGIYVADDFTGWQRTGDVSGIVDLQAALVGVDSFGGGTSYNKAILFGTGDGSSTATFDRVPHGCSRTSNACTTATTCTLTCGAGTKLTGGGCKLLSISAGDGYPSSDTVFTCDALAATTITAYGICCNM